MAAVSVRSSPGPSDGPNSSRIDMPSATPAQSQPRPPFGQAFGGMNGPSGTGTGTGTGTGAGSAAQPIQVRQTSPVKPDPSGAGQQAKPVVGVRNVGPIDMRAEEDAARRLNVGRVSGNSKFSGIEARGRKTDLFGPALRTMIDRRANNHQTTIDDEALAYLSKAAETRLREMLGSAISIQQHRTTTSFLHPPPRPSGSGSGSVSSSKSKTKPMWEVSVNNDPNAVIEVLNRQSKDAEREFRTARMERLAKEHEMDRVRERQAAMNGGDPSLQASGSGSGSGSGTAPTLSSGHPQTDSTEADSPGAHPPSSPDKHQASSPAAPSSSSSPHSNASPTFGGPRKVIPGKTVKKNPKDVSADVQIKMSNATAMRSAGMGKKYSWMSSAPQISSPLSGSKKKGKKGKSALGASGDGDGDADVDADGEVDAEGEADGDGDVAMTVSGEKKKRKSKPSTNTNNGGQGGSKRRKKMPTLPPRRMIPTGQFDPKGTERLVPDDRALTVYDLVFSMEREKGGQGMGTSDEVVRRVMARPGGVWGSAKVVSAAPAPATTTATTGSGSGQGAGSATGDKPK